MNLEKISVTGSLGMKQTQSKKEKIRYLLCIRVESYYFLTLKMVNRNHDTPCRAKEIHDVVSNSCTIVEDFGHF